MIALGSSHAYLLDLTDLMRVLSMVEAASAVAGSLGSKRDNERLDLSRRLKVWAAGGRMCRSKLDNVLAVRGIQHCWRRWVLYSCCRPCQSLHRHRCAASYPPLDVAGIVDPSEPSCKGNCICRRASASNVILRRTFCSRTWYLRSLGYEYWNNDGQRVGWQRERLRT